VLPRLLGVSAPSFHNVSPLFFAKYKWFSFMYKY
jgi:hypothetical protein